MRGKYFEELEVGNRWVSCGRTVTQTDIINFAGISGDFNPLHVDEEFAKTSIYGGVVASTPCLLALMSGMYSQLGHVEGTGLGYIDIKYLKVHRYVHPGETLHLELELAGKEKGTSPDFGIVTWREVLLTHRGEVIIEVERRAKLAKRPAGT